LSVLAWQVPVLQRTAHAAASNTSLVVSGTTGGFHVAGSPSSTGAPIEPPATQVTVAARADAAAPASVRIETASSVRTRQRAPRITKADSTR
jgi:hypothetical protein